MLRMGTSRWGCVKKWRVDELTMSHQTRASGRCSSRNSAAPIGRCARESPIPKRIGWPSAM